MTRRHVVTASAALALAVGALSACARPTSEPAVSAAEVRHEPTGPVRHVVLVTIDGLLPDSYLHPDAHGLSVPTLRRFVREGGHGDGTRSVFPSLTYPAHTSIATGVTPQKHGIVSNRAFDPLDKNAEAWYWYAEDIKAPPLWELARRRGLRTALINWPVSVGAQVNWLVPEYWRSREPEDLKLVRALSTPGLLESVQRDVPDLFARFTPPQDSASVDVASHVIRGDRPHLLLLHIWQVDHAQHHDGLWSPAALSAVENADSQIARLLQTLDQAGIAKETAVVIASDHGFANTSRQVHPGALLREAGLITLDAQGKPSAYRVAVSTGGGTAYLYAREGEDAATEATARALFVARAGKPGSGIGRLFERAEIQSRGGDPRAFLALEAEDGVYFGSGLASFETPPPYRATHGYDPLRPEMSASLLWLAPGVKPGARHDTQLVDIAPTIAKWLELDLQLTDGHALE